MSSRLLTSYNESIGKIVGCDSTELRIFELPTNVKAKRKKFWDDFFSRYSRNVMEESNDELHNCIQSWINTGYMPYDRLKSNTHPDSFSHSICDTTSSAISIYADMTMEVEPKTMAIVEDAKHNVVNDQVKHTEMTEVITNEMYIREHEDSTFNGNDSSCEQHSENSCEISNCLSQPEVVDTGKRRRRKLYTARDSPVDIINMTNSNRSSNKSKIFKLTKDLHPALDPDYSYKFSKKHKMKKMKRISKAFNSFYVLSPGKRIQRKKKPGINKVSKMMLDTINAVDTFSVNNNVKSDLVVNGMLGEYNGDHCLNTSLINESIDDATTIDKTTVNRTVNESTDDLDRGSNNVIKESTNINPVVRLVRLSEDVIARYIKSKKAVEDLSTTDIIESSKFNGTYRDLKKSIRKEKEIKSKGYLNTTVNTSISDIQKYVKPSYVGMNLNPVVYIERPRGEFRIQKYKKSTRAKTNSERFNPVVVLKKLSDSDIHKYKCVNNKRATNKSDLICKKMQLQKSGMKNTFELKSSESNNSNSTLNVKSLRCKKPISPQNIFHESCNSNTFWTEDSSTSSEYNSVTYNNQSCSPTVKVSSKRSFEREKKDTEKAHKLNRRGSNRTISSTRRDSSFVTRGESAKSNNNSRVTTLFPFYPSDDDGEDYEKFIFSLNKLSMPSFEELVL